MFGRLRTFRHIGGEVRGEWANRPFLAGMSQTSTLFTDNMGKKDEARIGRIGGGRL